MSDVVPFPTNPSANVVMLPTRRPLTPDELDGLLACGEPVDMAERAERQLADLRATLDALGMQLGPAMIGSDGLLKLDMAIALHKAQVRATANRERG